MHVIKKYFALCVEKRLDIRENPDEISDIIINIAQEDDTRDLQEKSTNDKGYTAENVITVVTEEIHSPESRQSSLIGNIESIVALIFVITITTKN